ERHRPARLRQRPHEHRRGPVPPGPRPLRHRGHRGDRGRRRPPRRPRRQLLHVGVAGAGAGGVLRRHPIGDVARPPDGRHVLRQHPGRRPGGALPGLRRPRARALPGRGLAPGPVGCPDPDRGAGLDRLHGARRARGRRPRDRRGTSPRPQRRARGTSAGVLPGRLRSIRIM
ncbi:MAG: Nitrilotriacetate monooxygenase component B, partial [uncultured Acidimicrobiales bacterium]